MDSKKRSRNDDDDVEESSIGSLDVKRIRADLFEILESEPTDRDGSDPVPAVDELDSVMRSFEEEIATAAVPSDPVSVPTPDPYLHQPDLGFLLEASDDELGIPPAESSGCGGSVGADAVTAGDDGEPIWGLEEFHLEFGSDDSVSSGADADDNGVLFDGGLFGSDDANCGAPEFSDMTWRPEFSV